jgi:hypothetical protein
MGRGFQRGRAAEPCAGVLRHPARERRRAFNKYAGQKKKRFVRAVLKIVGANTETKFRVKFLDYSYGKNE